MLPINNETPSNPRQVGENEEQNTILETISSLIIKSASNSFWNSFIKPVVPSITDFRKFKEGNVWPNFVFIPVFLSLSPGQSYRAILVCKSWARDGLNLLITTHKISMKNWVAFLPENTDLLLQPPEKLNSLENLREFLELRNSDEAAIQSKLQTYTLDQLRKLQAQAIEKSVGSYEQSLISLVIIQKEKLLYHNALQTDNSRTILSANTHFKESIQVEWDRLLNLKEIPTAVTVMSQFFDWLGSNCSKKMQDAISKITDSDVLFQIPDQIKQLVHREPSYIPFVQAEILTSVYLQLIIINQSEKAIQFAQKNGHIYYLCWRLIIKMTSSKEIKKQELKTLVELLPKISDANKRQHLRELMLNRNLLPQQEIDAIFSKSLFKIF